MTNMDYLSVCSFCFTVYLLVCFTFFCLFFFFLGGGGGRELLFFNL